MRRYIMMVFLAALAGPALGYNETVAAISYNPSRVGAYSYLKAVTEAKLLGGLDVAQTGTATTEKDHNMHIVSTGAVGLNTVSSSDPNQHECPSSGACDLETNPTLVNYIEEIKPFETETTTLVSGAQAVMQGPAAGTRRGQSVYTYPDLVYMTSTTNLLPTVNIVGGRDTASYLAFKAVGDSYIDTIKNDGSNSTVANLDMYAGNLVELRDLKMKNSFTFGSGTVVPETCNPTSCNSYVFVKRVDDNGREAFVLAIRKP